MMVFDSFSTALLLCTNVAGKCEVDRYKVVAVATPITAAGVMIIVFYFLYRKMIKNTRYG